MAFLNLMKNRLNPKEVNEALTNGGGGSKVNLDYSITPIKTGLKFLDKDIYRVLIPYSQSSNSITVGDTMEFNAPSGIETPISSTYVFDGTAGNYGMIIQANQTRVSDGKCKVYVDSASFSGVPGNTFYLMLDFTMVTSTTKKKVTKKATNK